MTLDTYADLFDDEQMWANDRHRTRSPEIISWSEGEKV